MEQIFIQFAKQQDEELGRVAGMVYNDHDDDDTKEAKKVALAAPLVYSATGTNNNKSPSVAPAPQQVTPASVELTTLRAVSSVVGEEVDNPVTVHVKQQSL